MYQLICLWWLDTLPRWNHAWDLSPLPCYHPVIMTYRCFLPWWRHQMETFSALLALCVGNSPVTGEFPSQRPVTQSFDVFFVLCLDEQLSKQSWSWWFDTPLCSLWHHCNVNGWPGTVMCYDICRYIHNQVLIWYACTWSVLDVRPKQNVQNCADSIFKY